MSLSSPAETIPFHLVGYTWASGQLELLWRVWPAPPASAPYLPSHRLALEVVAFTVAPRCAPRTRALTTPPLRRPNR